MADKTVDEDIEPIIVDVMAALHCHNPNMETVTNALTRILAGCILQTPPNLQAAMRSHIIHEINKYNDDNSTSVDLTNKLKSLQH